MGGPASSRVFFSPLLDIVEVKIKHRLNKYIYWWPISLTISISILVALSEGIMMALAIGILMGNLNRYLDGTFNIYLDGPPKRYLDAPLNSYHGGPLTLMATPVGALKSK
jgi:hypothetical protein